MRIRTAGLIASMALFATPGAAQQLRGTVTDSTSGIPIAGTVVVGRDAAGAVVARTMADAAGRYAMRAGGVTSVQVLRIGFRPRTLSVGPLRAGDSREMDIALVAIPTFLDQAQITGDRAQCPRRSDATVAGNLYLQARAGLLAAVVAREASPARVTRLAFDRTLDANGTTAVSQTVRMETTDRATASFNPVRTAVDFVARGFTADTGGERTYLGPDADVLLDDGFAAAYCFRIAAPDPARPALVGLAFTPAAQRDGRVDIDGTLWIDTVARRLHSTEFRYLGLDVVSTGFGAGGSVSYREVQPGLVLIDRWTLRIVGSGQAPGAAQPASGRLYEIHEIGGELASADWPDGRTWRAPLGTLRLTASTSDGTPIAAGTTLGLVGTDYRASADAAGAAVFTQLVPGPYTVMATDSALANIGLTIPVGASFVAQRDSTVMRAAQVPSAAEFVATLCGASGRVGSESVWLVGRIGTGDGNPAANTKWRLSRGGDAGGWVTVADGGATGTSGLFTHCRNLAVGQTIQLQAWRDNTAPTVLVRKLTAKVTVLPVRLPSAIVARGAGPATLSGTVLDSVSHQAVAGAYLEFVGTRQTAISDSAGSYTVANLPRGEYTVEVRTPALDRIGAVGRTTLSHDGTAHATVYVPTMAEMLRAFCGPAAHGGTGVVVGRVQLSDTLPKADHIRLVAVWTEAAAPARDSAGFGHARWVQTRADANGAFRVCGVPVGVALAIRTEVDSGVDAAARPQVVTLSAEQPIARVDLGVEPGLALGAALTGTVVADSTSAPLGGVEVALPDIGMSVMTNADGAFRIDDIAPGTRRVVVRRPGFTPITADVGFTPNQTIDHHIVLGRAAVAVALAPVTVSEAPGVNPEFDAGRKLGLGAFLTRADLEKYPGRPLSHVMASIPSFGTVTQANASHAWVVGKRVPPHLAPRGAAGGECGSASPSDSRKLGAPAMCAITPEGLRDQGIYCPESSAEQMQGVTCACYAQVWVDGTLMNRQRPTEPFDVNAYPPELLDGVEWYASPSQTPARYSSLNSPCGVLALWTRRTNPPHQHTTLQER